MIKRKNAHPEDAIHEAAPFSDTAAPPGLSIAAPAAATVKPAGEPEIAPLEAIGRARATQRLVITSPVAANETRGRRADAPTRFSEKDLQAQILDLVKRKDTDGATKLLIDMLPLIHAANVNIKEKMNNLLFLSRAIQQGGGAKGGGSKYGHVKLRAKVKTLATFTQNLPLPEGGFVELGCGAHDPIGLSVYFYLNGLTPACGVDLLPPRTDYFSAVSMYEILANVKMFPGRYTWGGRKPHEILTRLRDIDVACFERGDLWAGLEGFAGKVRLINDDLLCCDIAPGSIALFTSFAVLEHVSDIDAIFRRSFELLAPGGIAYHFADLADHRSYRGDGQFGPLSFLTESLAPPNMNRLRAHEITAAARAAGFELITDQRVAAELSSNLKSRLVSPFAAMHDDEIAVVKQHLVLRKPD